MDRVGDQLLAGARFPLDQYRGIGRRHSLDVFEHRFQSRTVADNPLKASLSRLLIPGLELLPSTHS
jgi:hypothetical protein